MSADDSPGILDADMHVDDDEYVRRRRLKSINDSRERANDALAQAWTAYVHGEISQVERRAIFFSTVQGFLRDARKSIEKVDAAEEWIITLGEEEVAKDIGNWSPSPPQGPRSRSETRRRSASYHELLEVHSAAPVEVDSQANVLHAYGLDFVMRGSPHLDVSWRIHLSNHMTADETRVVHSKTPVPESVSLTAMDVALDLLDDTDLNLKMKDGQEYGAIYEDILELDR